MRIDAILFDLGGVMIELAGVERMLEWSPSLGTTDELWRRWLGSPAVRAYETGRTNREAFADAIVAEFELPVDAETFLGEDNVVALIEGSDPVLKNEYVLFSTLVDHLGSGDPVGGDAIYNGAVDNASGCAVLLEVARAVAGSPARPRRSLVFLFVAAEEPGLLGSDYFACHPTIPKEQIVADITFDGGTSLTPVSDLIAWGAEHSSLQAAVQHAASQTGLTVSPDPFPEEGVFVRTDEFSFVKQGIPQW